MSDTFTDDDPSTATNDDNLRHLREQAGEARAAKDEAVKAKRQIMFLRAGIDVDSADPRHAKLAKMLFSSFEGDDVEALRAEASEIGLLEAPAASNDAENRAQEQFRRDLSQGRAPDAREVPTEDPNVTALDEFHRIRKAGGALDDARIAAFGEVFGAALNGDGRVLFDQEQWDKKAAQYGHGARGGRGRA